MTLRNLLPGETVSGEFAKVYTDLTLVEILLGTILPEQRIQSASPDGDGNYFFDLFDPGFAGVQL